MTSRRNLERSVRFAPQGLQVSTFRVGDSEYAVLEWLAPEEAFSPLLTRTEQEVARHALQGLSNSEIARRRGTSPRTVANQMASIFRKLGLSSRLQLFAFAAGCQENSENQGPVKQGASSRHQ